MNDNENRKHQMFVRTQQFLAGRSADFATGSLGKQLALIFVGAHLCVRPSHTCRMQRVNLLSRLVRTSPLRDRNSSN